MSTPPQGELADKTHGKLRENERDLHLFEGIRPITRAGTVRDALAGFTLAAMNVPQALRRSSVESRTGDELRFLRPRPRDRTLREPRHRLDDTERAT